MLKKICLFIILGLTSCLDISKPYPEKQYYLIQPQREIKKLNTIKGSVLKISEFRVSPSFNSQGLVYQTEENQYAADFYNEYFVPISVMMNDATTRWLEDSGLFEYIAIEGSLQESNYVLEAAVNKIYGDFRDDKNPKAILKMQFLLLQINETSNQLVYSGGYQQEITIAEANAQGLIKGINDGLAKILQALEEDLQKKLR